MYANNSQHALCKYPQIVEKFLHIDINQYLELMHKDIAEEYKNMKLNTDKAEEKKKNMSLTINGGMVNISQDHSKMNINQNNGIDIDELEKIVKGIKDDMSNLNQQEQDEVMKIVNSIKLELIKPVPRIGKLRSCLTMLAPTFTIANGIPTLMNNIQQLKTYVMTMISEIG